MIITKHLEDGVGKVLLGAILYAYKDPLGLTYLPSTLITRIQRYERNHGITIKVKQIKLILRKNGTSATFLDVSDENSELAPGASGETAIQHIARVQHMHTQMLETMMQKLTSMDGSQNSFQMEMKNQIRDMNACIVSLATYRRNGNVNINRPAKLSRVKTLGMLWSEYTIGLNGNKPAKSFTAIERGADKSKYCRRKRFWDAVEKLTADYGINSLLAISRIYTVYGKNNATVTKVLEELGKDKNLTSYSAYAF